MTRLTSRRYKLNLMMKSNFIWRFFNRSVPENFRMLRLRSKREELMAVEEPPP